MRRLPSVFLVLCVVLASPAQAQGSWGAWQTISGGDQTNGCGVDVRYRDTGERPNAEGRHHLWYGARNRCAYDVTVRFTFSNHADTTPYDDLLVPAGRDRASWTYAANFAGAAVLKADHPLTPSVPDRMASVEAWHVLNDWASRVERATARYNEILRRFTPGPGSQVLTWGKLLDQARRDVSRLRGLLEQTTGNGTTDLANQIEETTRGLQGSESPFQSAWTSAEREADRERASQEEANRRETAARQEQSRRQAARQETERQSDNSGTSAGTGCSKYVSAAECYLAGTMSDAERDQARRDADDQQREDRQDAYDHRSAGEAARQSERRGRSAVLEARTNASTVTLTEGGAEIGRAEYQYEHRCLDHRGSGYGKQLTLDAPGRLVATSNYFSICVIDYETGREVQQLSVPNEKSYAGREEGKYEGLKLVDGGSTLVTFCSRCGGDKGAIVWFDVATGKITRRVQPKERLPHSTFTMSADGRLALMGGYEDKAQLVDFTTGKIVQSFTSPTVAWWKLSPDGRIILQGTQGAPLMVRSAMSGEAIGQVRVDTSWYNITWSPDGKLFAASSYPAGLQVWNAQTLSLITRIPEAYGAALAFSPDGKWVLAQTFDEVRLYRTEGGASVGTLYRRPEREEGTSPWDCRDALFGPDGHSVACVQNSVLKKWQLTWYPAESRVPANGTSGAAARERVQTLMQVGVNWYSDKLYGDAANVFEQAASLEPYNRDVLFDLANTYLAMKDGAKLLETAEKLVALEPMSETALRMVGEGYRKANRMGEALKIAEKVLALPMDVKVTEFSTSRTSATLTATATGRSAQTPTGRAISPSALVLAVEFLDATGRVVDTQIARLPALGKGSIYEFKVAGQGADIVAWRQTADIKVTRGAASKPSSTRAGAPRARPSVSEGARQDPSAPAEPVTSNSAESDGLATYEGVTYNALRFFESPGDVPIRSERKYVNSFQQANTRSVILELSAKAPDRLPANLQYTCDIFAVPSYELVATLVVSPELELGGNSTYAWGAWGSAERGSLKTGSFSAGCLHRDKVEVAGGKFTIR
jgi:tetratricopeptide (TPR) repeat protein